MNELLEKYWEGTTSREEEQRLKRYFASGNIAQEHKVYKAMFKTFEMEKGVEASFDAFAKVKPQASLLHKLKNHKWKSLAVAASFGILFALGAAYQDYNKPKQDLGTYETPEEAYEATVHALQFMGTKINAGKANLAPLNTLEEKTSAVFIKVEDSLTVEKQVNDK